MDKIKYLERIGYKGSINPTDEVLRDLHQKHVHHVPFENLDVHNKRIFDLDITNIYQKVVNDRRGGFCYELNLLFNWLLTELGFSSRIIASRIFNEQGAVGPNFDHMAVYVKTEKEFLVDVGYGDLFITPIEIASGIQSDGRNYFKIDSPDNDDYVLSMSQNRIGYENRYSFNLDVVKPEDFISSCLDKQVNPNSYFVKNIICTMPTNEGRITIFNDKFVKKTSTSREETLLQGDDDLRRCLKEKFGMVVK